MNTVNRNLQARVEELLKLFPVVAILGARQSGKTTLSKMSTNKSWSYFDMEKGDDYDFITKDFPFFFKEYPHKVIIDEAQESKQLFRELRSVIDDNRKKKGRFIITGSSSPELSSKLSETLAGRVAILELGTLKMNERYSLPLSNFYKIIKETPAKKQVSALMNLKTNLKYDDVMEHFLSGGYPEPVLSLNKEFRLQWMDNYMRTYVERDTAKLFPGLNNIDYRRFISILAELSGSIVNRAEIARTLSVSEPTVRNYLDISEGTFIWYNLCSFQKSTSKSITKMARGYIRDSGLSNYLLKINDRERLLRHPGTGMSFEAFVTEEIKNGFKGVGDSQIDYYYFRTKNGAEVDLIIDTPAAVIPIEIKLGISVKKNQLYSLTQFINDNNCPYGILLNNSNEIKKLTEKIIQIPASYI